MVHCYAVKFTNILFNYEFANNEEQAFEQVKTKPQFHYWIHSHTGFTIDENLRCPVCKETSEHTHKRNEVSNEQMINYIQQLKDADIVTVAELNAVALKAN